MLVRLIALAFVGAAASVVLWHSAHAVVLWDLSYILELAYRIRLGEIPYRDFVLPHAPGTFLVQAALMRLPVTGLLPHHIYCAVVSAVTAGLTYTLVRAQLLDANTTGARVVAWLVVMPVIWLNGYAMFPQPFYDPDCVAAVLAALALVAWARRRGGPWPHAIAGAALVLPPLFKQNIGLAAAVLTMAALGVSALASRNRRERLDVVACLLGAALGLLAAAAAIQFWIGLGTYTHWTITFAAARRWPSASLVFGWYAQWRTWIAPAAAIAGFLWIRGATRRGSRGAAVVVLAGFALIALPFADATLTMWRYGLLARAHALWGVAVLAGGLAALARARRRQWSFLSLLPIVAIGIAHAAFMSQGLYDSAFAVWPLFVIAVAPLAGRLCDATPRRLSPLAFTFVALASVWLSVLGCRQVMRHDRLGFADMAGVVERATLPRLEGLATPGSYVADFERLLTRTAALIPANDSVVAVPGEDPFFFASGRTPSFPVALFDDTVTPYDRAALMRMLAERRTRWIIVKDRLQLHHQPWSPLAAFVASDLPSAYDVIETLPRYTILRRRPGVAP